MMLANLTFTIRDLHWAYAEGLSPVDVVAEVYRRVNAANDPGIFISLASEEALRAAAESLGEFNADQPLWGIPFAVKDNIDTAGLTTTAGCPAFAYTPSQDAFVIARLRDAGALLIGKTNLDQFAAGLVGVRSPFPPPLNAVNPALVPGGSSSGSAVSVSRGLVAFSLGTDTAGSGRVPAALNAIVGLKPTRGAISASGVVPACRTLDTISIFALTVDDATTVAQTAYAHDPDDSFSRSLGMPSLTRIPERTTLGVPRAEDLIFFDDSSQEDGFHKGLKALRALGVELREISFAPFYAIAERLYAGAWVAERYTVVEKLLRQMPEALHPVTRKVICQAEALTAPDVFRDFYTLSETKVKVARLMAGLDGLCVPSIPALFSRDAVEADPIQLNSRLGVYTNFVNLLDMCGIAIPLPADEPDQPQSVTLLGHGGTDGPIASLGNALFEHVNAPLGVTGGSVAPRPRSGVGEAMADEMLIVAVGAHMSGLPLNGQLTELGGRFVEASQTADCYRLYALYGGPPARPGLVRQDNGRRIDIEIWALPSNNIGKFLAQIPPPLGIGSIALEDGRLVKGFICEGAGLSHAEDITEFGGWRAYLEAVANDSKAAKVT